MSVFDVVKANTYNQPPEMKETSNQVMKHDTNIYLFPVSWMP